MAIKTVTTYTSLSGKRDVLTGGGSDKKKRDIQTENRCIQEHLLDIAKSGHLAQYKLAVASFYGFDGGTPGRDIERALFWINEAASNNTCPQVKKRAKNMLQFFSLFQQK
ncbi:MAG: SEL1-like repeat protein [Puniceicoccales bacterium]|jgi:hypothetical protein|nr:SEL1-like repeat protein [Puniceicoccales bacterium]